MSATPPLPPQSDASSEPGRPARWPRVFGVLSCLYAAVLFFEGPIQVITGIRRNLQWAARDLPAPAFVHWGGIGGIIYTGLGIVLLLGAIRLFRRRPSAAVLHQVFAIGMLAMGAAETLVGPAPAIEGRPPPSPDWLFWPIALAYPLLCLVWFSPEAVRNQLAAWGKQRAGAVAPPRWPKVLGILSVALGAIGLAVAHMALLGAIGHLAELTEPAAGAHGWAVLRVLTRGFAVATEVILVAGGIQLLRRKRSARALLIVYGILGVHASVVNLATAITRYPRPHYDAFLSGCLLAFVYPVFCLIWFSRRKVQSQFAEWLLATPPPADRPPRWPKAVALASCLVVATDLAILAWLSVEGGVTVETSAPNGTQEQLLLPAHPIALGVDAAVLAVLLVGTIQLLRRKAMAKPLHLIYAIAWLALGVFGTVQQLVTFPFRDVHFMFAFGYVSGMIMMPVYPLFCLIWFSRKTIREQIRGWRCESAAEEAPKEIETGSAGDTTKEPSAGAAGDNPKPQV